MLHSHVVLVVLLLVAAYLLGFTKVSCPKCGHDLGASLDRCHCGWRR